MKKTVAIVLALMMLMSVLAGCSSSTTTTTDTSTTDSSTTTTTTSTGGTAAAPDTTTTSDSEDAHSDKNAIKDLVVYRTGNDIESFLHVNSENASDALASLGIENWIGVGTDGNVTYLIADDYYSNDDASQWTFHLREGVSWVDKDLNKKADLKVTDFLVGAEFILNYYKNGGKCASMLQSNVEGAKEYYEYTKTLTEEEALKLTYKDAFSEMVGIAADTSANTVTYTCTQPTPYFWSLGYHKCTSALAEELVDEIGVENMVGISWDKIWYTGAYVITDFIAGNTCVLSKNTTYWNYDNVTLFDTITSNMIESTDVGYQLYDNGELDFIYLSQSNLVNILNDSSNKYHDMVTKAYGTTATYVMHFNYDKVDPDTGEADTNWNTAIANENFRMALYWGLDLGSYYSFVDPVSPYSIAGYTFTQNSFVNIDGVDYQDYVINLIGLEKSDEYDSRYVPEKAAEYMDAAVEELTAAGVTFPIHIDNYIPSGNQSKLDQATILKAAFDASFGDYIEFENKTYISSYTKEVINFRYQNYVISGWTADYSDPSNTIEQVSSTNSNNAYLDYSNVLNLTEGAVYDLYQEFDELCDTARAITDLNERYKAYAEAEAFMLEHNLAMPMYMNANWQLTNINDYSKALKGQSYQNWETNSEGYSTADYNTFAAEKSEG